MRHPDDDLDARLRGTFRDVADEVATPTDLRGRVGKRVVAHRRQARVRAAAGTVAAAVLLTVVATNVTGGRRDSVEVIPGGSIVATTSAPGVSGPATAVPPPTSTAPVPTTLLAAGAPTTNAGSPTTTVTGSPPTSVTSAPPAAGAPAPTVVAGPTTTSTAVAGPAAQCPYAALDLVFAPLGGGDVALTWTNRGVISCTVAGSPEVRFVDEAGNSSPMMAIGTGEPAYRIIELAPGARVRSTLTRQSPDPDEPCRAEFAFTSVRIYVPGNFPGTGEYHERALTGIACHSTRPGYAIGNVQSF